MKIKKDTVKSIRETAYVVNGFSKNYRNPRNSFLFLASDGDYLTGDFQQIENNKFYCRKGNMGYTVTIQ